MCALRHSDTIHGPIFFEVVELEYLRRAINLAQLTQLMDARAELPNSVSYNEWKINQMSESSTHGQEEMIYKSD